jgi:hypothetical protein
MRLPGSKFMPERAAFEFLEPMGMIFSGIIDYVPSCEAFPFPHENRYISLGLSAQNAVEVD